MDADGIVSSHNYIGVAAVMQRLRRQHDLMEALGFEHEPAFAVVEEDFHIVPLASQMAGVAQHSGVEVLLAEGDTLLVYRSTYVHTVEIPGHTVEWALLVVSAERMMIYTISEQHRRG